MRWFSRHPKSLRCASRGEISGQSDQTGRGAGNVVPIAPGHEKSQPRRHNLQNDCHQYKQYAMRRRDSGCCCGSCKPISVRFW